MQATEAAPPPPFDLPPPPCFGKTVESDVRDGRVPVSLDVFRSAGSWAHAGHMPHGLRHHRAPTLSRQAALSRVEPST